LGFRKFLVSVGEKYKATEKDLGRIRTEQSKAKVHPPDMRLGISKRALFWRSSRPQTFIGV
jgi:hypothetical protein